jgi:hypothetical protein
MGNDELARWWRQRSASQVECFRSANGSIQFVAQTDHADGMVVKIPTQAETASICRCSGREAAFENRYEFGQNWVYVVTPSGECEIEVQL